MPPKSAVTAPPFAVACLGLGRPVNFTTSLVGMGAIDLTNTRGLVTNAGGKVTPDF